jgi:hypothetical protein
MPGVLEGWLSPEELRSILDECQDDFHVCEKCWHQDNNATKESNLYLLLRAALEK